MDTSAPTPNPSSPGASSHHIPMPLAPPPPVATAMISPPPRLTCSLPSCWVPFSPCLPLLTLSLWQAVSTCSGGVTLEPVRLAAGCWCWLLHPVHLGFRPMASTSSQPAPAASSRTSSQPNRLLVFYLSFSLRRLLFHL